MPSMTQIKASAGSGKTWTLTQKFLAHLASLSPGAARSGACTLHGPEEDWRSVMAITFTNAAATEMQERVLKVLKERALNLDTESAPGLTPRDARVWLERIMHDRSSLNISTIDSLLNLIVRMSALAQKLPPDFDPVFASSDILDPYWQAVSNEAWQDNEDLRKLIASICESTVRYSDRNDFKAGDIIRNRLANILELIFRDKLEDLTPAEVFQTWDGKGLLPRIKKRLFSLIDTIVRADGKCADGCDSPVVMDKTFKKGLQKVLIVAEGKLGKKTLSASLAELARLRLDTDLLKALDSASFKKSAIKTVKASGPVPDDLAKSYDELVLTCNDLLPIDHLHTQSRIHEPLITMARLIHKRYAANLQHEGLVPNDRIPIMVRDILSGDFGVADALCRMGTRISHFLVDEFQDTSRDHWEALKPLVAEALSSGGSLSWVGDVKQAIYGFRGGDSELFDDIAQDADLTCMLDSGVDRQTLENNWRSRKEIIAFNNALFAPLEYAKNCELVLVPDDEKVASYQGLVGEVPSLIQDAEDPETPILEHVAAKMAQAYQKGAQKPSPRTLDGGRVTLIRFGEGGEGSDGDEGKVTSGMDEVVDEQLLAVSLVAQREHAEGTPWADLLVLVRTNRKAMELARHLSSEGIPVITENSLLLSDHPLIVQTIALLSFLRAPEDDVAFWTVASGSIVARDGERDVSRPLLDTELSLLSRLRKKRRDLNGKDTGRDVDDDDAFEEISQDMPEALLGDSILQGKGRPSLALLWQRLHPEAWETIFAPLLDASGSITPYDMVSEWYARENVLERFPEAGPFLQRFLEILYTSQGRGIRSLGDFLDYWNEHGQEEKVPMPEGMDAVRIMTTHKAKGLQAPVVITPWTSQRTRTSAETMVVEYITPLHPQPLRALATCKSFFPMRTAMDLKDAFEAINRFYVAFTRAERRLYVFLSEKPQGDGKQLERLLELAGPAIPEALPWSEYRDVHEPAGDRAEGCIESAHSDPLEPGKTGNTAARAKAWDMGEREGYAADSAWSPMAWMPNLRLHFDFLDESHPRDRAREEGVFVHACLEEMARLPEGVRDNAGDYARARERIVTDLLAKFPWLGDGTNFRERTAAELSWYAALDERCGWMRYGLPEQSIATKNGKILRTDLLVLHPEGPMVIEYKHGQTEESFMVSYHAQVRAYLNTLKAADPSCNPLGVIVYLKPRRLHLVFADGTSLAPDGPVRGNLASVILLAEEEFARLYKGPAGRSMLDPADGNNEQDEEGGE
ncbi:hypothetical protein B5F76_04855 [Desulfovibrio sp. An276]|nr:hypothetical protein B5F76_04855 [Desulfovibrio sp. An276]